MTKVPPAKTRAYGVKLVRGPFVSLPPHRLHCGTTHEVVDLAARLRADDPAVRLAVDLFSGCGGLSHGLTQAGFTVIGGVDHFQPAVDTHAHHFPGLSVDWDLSDPDVVEQVAGLITEAGVDLVAGGPPCQPFSKAGRSLIRQLVKDGKREPHDARRDLWRSFMEVVRLSRPPAVLMENVPDMALDREMFILRSMVEDFESMGYSVEEKVVDTWRYGVPQFRQRLILVALRDGLRFDWPDESEQIVTVWNAIGDLPEVEGGWRPEGGAEGWAEYAQPVTSFQKSMRDGVDPDRRSRIYDHITRPVRSDDVLAFEAMDSGTKYSDLPVELKRYRDDIFDDKYKRLDENDLSRTITAHIAKDGYWYIHPRQHRTITVREAARLQTFPDWFRFSGPPSAAFKQIGNAVPPRLGRALGQAILSALSNPRPGQPSSREVARSLAEFASSAQASPPWLRATTRWQVISAETLLERAEATHIRFLWPMLEKWAAPKDTLENESALRSIGEALGRAGRVDRLIDLASKLLARPDTLADLDPDGLSIPGLGEAVRGITVLAVRGTDRDITEPVLATKGVLRVTARYLGEPVDRRNRLTDGRLSVARMIGGGDNSRAAHLGLITLANSLCRPADPLCGECPLNKWCAYARSHHDSGRHLF